MKKPGGVRYLIILGALVLGSRGLAVAQPILNSINPSTVTARGPQFTLTLLGSGFSVSSVVTVNGNNRATVFVSPLQLTATILASDIAVPATLLVAVVIPGVPGTKPLPLTVTPAVALPPPTLSRIGPGVTAQGTDRIQITLVGANFRPGATVIISPPIANINTSTATVAFAEAWATTFRSAPSRMSHPSPTSAPCSTIPSFSWLACAWACPTSSPIPSMATW